MLAAGLPGTMKKSGTRNTDLINLDKVPELINSFVAGNEKEVWLVFENPEELWQNFKSHFILIQAAGGVVREDDKFLFIFRRGKWDLPKGKIDKGETAECAALREVEEECGISSLSILKNLPTTWHIYQSPYPGSLGKWILKETIWYEMYHETIEDLKPQTEEGITEARWIRTTGFDQILRNTYPNLEQIIRLYL